MRQIRMKLEEVRVMSMKKSIEASYLTSGGVKKGGGNTKKNVKVAKGLNYSTLAAKKTLNHLWYALTQAPIFQYFDPKWHIWIETNASNYAIGAVLSQLTLNDLGR